MRYTQTSLLKTVLLVGIFSLAFFCALVALPSRAHAQANTAADANAFCAVGIWDETCACGFNKDLQTGACTQPLGNKKDCKYQNTTNKVTTTCHCDFPGHCKADTSGGSPVDSALQQLGQMLGQALQKLMSGGGGGGGGGQPPPGGGAGNGLPPGFDGKQPCTSFRQVSTPSSDPCDFFVPNSANDLGNTTGGGNTANDLLNSLNGAGNTANTPSVPGTASNLGGADNTSGRTNNQPSGGTPGGSIGITLGGTAGTPACTSSYFVTQTPSTDLCAIYVPASSVSNGITTGAATGGAPACAAAYFVTQTPSTDPCAIYVPSSSVSNGITTGNSSTGGINNSNTNVGGSGGGTQPSHTTPAPNSLIGLISNPANLSLASTTQTVVKNADGTVSTTTTYSFFGAQITVPNGATPSAGDFTSFTTIANIISGGPGGDLQIGGNGATFSSSNRDFQNNTAVSGFFGANTTVGAGPQSVAAWLCHTRPWANSIFSRIISASFFDSLCAKRGYQVGMPPAPPRPVAPVLTQTPVRAATKPAAKPATAPTVQTPTPPAVPAVPPRVQIWAVPASVSIGSRTSIFWSARGVASCIETSPDGSFHQTTLSGGASTVPLTSATTYTISCLTPDGTPATAFFTVKMAI